MTEVLERLRDAQNRHDLDAFVACFHPEYRSQQPVHPDRALVMTNLADRALGAAWVFGLASFGTAGGVERWGCRAWRRCWRSDRRHPSRSLRQWLRQTVAQFPQRGSAGRALPARS